MGTRRLMFRVKPDGFVAVAGKAEFNLPPTGRRGGHPIMGSLSLVMQGFCT